MAENATDAVIYSYFWEQMHCAFLTFVIIAALFGNGFVCIAVCKVRRLQKVSNYFLVSLAVSDILVVLLAVPFRIYFELNRGWLLGEHACKFWIFMDMLCSTASVVNLSLISVDRYLALSQSLRYLAIATTSRCVVGITTVWTFSFTLAALSLHTWYPGGQWIFVDTCEKIDKTYYTISTVFGIIIPLVMLLVLYYLVFKIALEQRKKIMKNDFNTSRSSDDTSGLCPHSNSKSPRRFAIHELKATKTLIIVVGCFLVCWVPLFVLLILQQYARDYIYNLPVKTQEVLGLLLLYSLPYFNSCLNPYIYTRHNKEFRDVFKKSFGKLLPFLKLKSKNERNCPFTADDTDFASTAEL